MKLAHQVFPGSSGAPTLLLLHGVTRNGRDWEPLLPGLTRHWRVLVTDHCGHGNSPRSASAQPSGLATYVTAHRSSGVQNVSRKLIPKSSARWSLVAGSMGSKLGIYGRALAARHCCCKAILQQAEHSPTLQFYRLAEPCAATSTFASPEPAIRSIGLAQ
jgi:pimeloyl-ACP methyl ester carboxylesterase